MSSVEHCREPAVGASTDPVRDRSSHVVETVDGHGGGRLLPASHPASARGGGEHWWWCGGGGGAVPGRFLRGALHQVADCRLIRQRAGQPSPSHRRKTGSPKHRSSWCIRKMKLLKQIVKGLVFENAALCTKLQKVQQQVVVNCRRKN